MVECSLRVPFFASCVSLKHLYSSFYLWRTFKLDKGKKISEAISVVGFFFFPGSEQCLVQNLLKLRSLCYKAHTSVSSLYLCAATEALFIHSLNLQPHSVTGLGIWAHMQMLGCVAKLRHFNKFAFED